MSTTLLISVAFEDDTDFDYFRERFVNACEEVAEAALHGDADTGEPARADGDISISWEVEE